jgi:hypothetical protein
LYLSCYPIERYVTFSRQAKGQYVSTTPLKPLHPQSSLSQAKLSQFRKLSTNQLIDSLTPGKPGSLKIRPDGTIIDGHHRIMILRERSVDVDSLPREIITKN